MKPDEQGFRSNARFDDATTNKTDYKPWEVQPIQTHRPDEYRKAVGEMDLNTMYNSEFTPKGFAKVEAIRPVERHGVSAKFDGSTTYLGDYKQWPEGRQAAIRANNGYVPPSVPFEGMSTYRGKSPERIGLDRQRSSRTLHPTRRRRSAIVQTRRHCLPFVGTVR